MKMLRKVVIKCSIYQTAIFFITFAGTPPTMVLGATSLVTTAPAATTAPSPMVTPAKTVAWKATLRPKTRMIWIYNTFISMRSL